MKNIAPIKSIDYETFFKLLRIDCDFGKHGRKVSRFKTAEGKKRKSL